MALFSTASRVSEPSCARLRSVRRVHPRHLRCSAAQNSGSPFEPVQEFVTGKTRRIQQKLSESANDLSSKASEAAKEADVKYGIRQRLRHAREDFNRLSPHWKRRFTRFSRSTAGKVTFWAALLYAISSGLLFKVVNLMFMVWWVVLLILVPLAQNRSRGSSGPGRMGGSPTTGPQGFPRGGARSAQAPFTSVRSQQRSNNSDGPVIDAQWVSVDR